MGRFPGALVITARCGDCQDIVVNCLMRPEAAWGVLAGSWDTSGATWTQPVAARLVDLAGLYPGMSVLDVGCGAGAAALAAARVVGHRGSVIGVDSAAAMVLRARREARNAGAGNAVFVCENATRLPYAQATFDAVIASMVVPHLPDPAGVLGSWPRLLRAGGVLAFSWAAAEDPAWQPVLDAIAQFLPADERPRPAGWWAPAEAEAMVPAGMEVCTVSEPVTVRYKSAEHWWRSDWSHEPAITWLQIPPSQRSQARKAAFAELAGLSAADGSLQRTRTVGYITARLPAARGRATGGGI